MFEKQIWKLYKVDRSDFNKAEKYIEEILNQYDEYALIRDTTESVQIVQYTKAIKAMHKYHEQFNK